MSKKEFSTEMNKSKNATNEKFSAQLKTKPLNPKQNNNGKESNTSTGGKSK